jgi:hypothetical protein
LQRAVLSSAAIALLLVVSALAMGCARGQAAAGATTARRALPSPVTWVKVVHLGGGLTGRNRGSSFVEFDVVGGGVRFVVTVGAAPGWGVKVARLRYWLISVTNGHVPRRPSYSTPRSRPRATRSSTTCVPPNRCSQGHTSCSTSAASDNGARTNRARPTQRTP